MNCGCSVRNEIFLVSRTNYSFKWGLYSIPIFYYLIGYNDKLDYSGTERSAEEHRKLVEGHRKLEFLKNALTISHRKDNEKDYGVK